MSNAVLFVVGALKIDGFYYYYSLIKKGGIIMGILGHIFLGGVAITRNEQSYIKLALIALLVVIIVLIVLIIKKKRAEKGKKTVQAGNGMVPESLYKRAEKSTETVQEDNVKIPLYLERTNNWLRNYFSEGVSSWDYNEKELDNIYYQGEFISGKQLLTIARDHKRNGNYSEAAKAYYNYFIAYDEKYRKIPYAVFGGGYIKLLFVVNEYYLAFNFLAVVLSDMEISGFSNPYYSSLWHTAYNVLMKDSISYIDDNCYYETIKGLTIAYSGTDNYHFYKTETQIRDELRQIRIQVKEIYGR